MKKTEQVLNGITTKEKSLKEIYEAFPDIKKPTVRNILNIGVKKNKIKRTKKGVYTK